MLLEVLAPWLIRIGLGEEWSGAVPFFRILSLTILPACVQVLCRNVMKTLGKTRKVMSVDSIISLLSLTLMIGGAFIDIDLIVWGIVFAQAAGAILWIRVAENNLIRQEIIRED